MAHLTLDQNGWKWILLCLVPMVISESPQTGNMDLNLTCIVSHKEDMNCSWCPKSSQDGHSAHWNLKYMTISDLKFNPVRLDNCTVHVCGVRSPMKYGFECPVRFDDYFTYKFWFNTSINGTEDNRTANYTFNEVDNVPLEVKNLKIKKNTSSSLQVSWELDEHEENEVIQCTSINGDCNWTSAEENGTNFKDLKANTEYIISMKLKYNKSDALSIEQRLVGRTMQRFEDIEAPGNQSYWIMVLLFIPVAVIIFLTWRQIRRLKYLTPTVHKPPSIDHITNIHEGCEETWLDEWIMGLPAGESETQGIKQHGLASEQSTEQGAGQAKSHIPLGQSPEKDSGISGSSENDISSSGMRATSTEGSDMSVPYTKNCVIIFRDNPTIIKNSQKVCPPGELGNSCTTTSTPKRQGTDLLDVSNPLETEAAEKDSGNFGSSENGASCSQTKKIETSASESDTSLPYNINRVMLRSMQDVKCGILDNSESEMILTADSFNGFPGLGDSSQSEIALSSSNQTDSGSVLLLGQSPEKDSGISGSSRNDTSSSGMRATSTEGSDMSAPYSKDCVIIFRDQLKNINSSQKIYLPGDQENSCNITSTPERRGPELLNDSNPLKTEATVEDKGKMSNSDNVASTSQMRTLDTNTEESDMSPPYSQNRVMLRSMQNVRCGIGQNSRNS